MESLSLFLPRHNIAGESSLRNLHENGEQLLSMEGIATQHWREDKYEDKCDNMRIFWWYLEEFVKKKY